MPSFAHAAGLAEEEAAGHAQPSSPSQQDLILAALQARSKIMFSGESGAAVASGIKDDAATAEKPTYGLIKAASLTLPHHHLCVPILARPFPYCGSG